MMSEVGARAVGPDPMTPTQWFSLRGRVAIITGAAQGIGLGIASAFAALEARVVLTDRNVAVEDAAKKLREKGLDASAVVFDVTDQTAIAKLAADAQARYGIIDVLVNNAAIVNRTATLGLERHDWHRVLDTNLSATFFMSQAFGRVMVSQKRGRIINMSSIVAHVAKPNLVAYTAAKGGIAAMTRALASDFAGTGITVNSIAPGHILTPMSSAVNEDFYNRVVRVVPAARFGTPQDVAAAAIFLASDAGSYVNGQTIYVDGGFTATVE
jgi:gluconate 5-dehydrogenase